MYTAGQAAMPESASGMVKSKGCVNMENKYEFRKRFDRHFNELKWLYCELYDNDMQKFNDLCKMIEQYYDNRKESLKDLDRKREQNPEWYHSNDIVGMALYVDNFAGDLKGVAEKIGYLNECGVNYIHLMPLLETSKGHGDGVTDFRKIQPELGTMDDLRDLTELFHQNNISCCLDFMMNHTSDEHAWAKAARNGDADARSRYFFYHDRDIPNEYEKTTPGTFTQLSDGSVVMTTFCPYQWDLNYANPAVFNDMAENMLYLANAGIDVIRLDAVAYIWKQPGTQCRNLPQVHAIVRMMHMICEIICPSVLLLGEVRMEPSNAAPYFGTADKTECDMLYHFTAMSGIWNTIATRDVRCLERQMKQISELPKKDVFLNYLRCHDDIGWELDYDWLRTQGMEQTPHKKFLSDYFIGKFEGSTARGELYGSDHVCGTVASLCGIEAALWDNDDKALKFAVNADIMLHAYMFTQSGIPVIYSGDEVGQLNDYMYHADIHKKFDSRYLHRGKFDWKLAEQRKDTLTYQGKIFKALRKLETIRANNDVFKASAEFRPAATGSKNVLGIYRKYGDQELLALFNFCEEYRRIDVYRNYTDLITGEYKTNKAIELEPYGFIWALLK